LVSCVCEKTTTGLESERMIVMDVIMFVIMLMFLYMCAWITARATVYWCIWHSTNARIMISRVINHTLIQTVLGVSVWLLLPTLSTILLAFMSLRFYFLIRMDWLRVYDEFDEIKHKLKDIQG
jgi:hypothetical protein